MKKIKLLIILLFVSTVIWAQNGRQRSMVVDLVPQTGQCTPLSQEEIDEINQRLSDMSAKIFAEKTGFTADAKPAKPKNYDEWWATSIFTDNPKLKFALTEKYKAYDEIRYGQNWKNSPYSDFTPEQISEKLNTLFNKTYTEMKTNPFYRSNNFASKCGQAGLILTDFAAFLILQEIAMAALPAATTVTEFSAISGFAWDFGPLFSTPALLKQTSTLGRIGSVGVGFGASMSVLDSFHSFINYLRGIPEEDKTALGAQKDLHIALKNDFDLAEQIKEIKTSQDLNPTQKRKRIDTRYKEAIIKIYALEYINTYLTYAEKPEKYLWALLDLTTLLQSRGTITFETDHGKTIEVDATARLIDRTPEMKNTLEKIMQDFIYGFKIPAYGKHLKEKVEKRALENIENAEFNFNGNF